MLCTQGERVHSEGVVITEASQEAHGRLFILTRGGGRQALPGKRGGKSKLLGGGSLWAGGASNPGLRWQQAWDACAQRTPISEFVDLWSICYIFRLSFLFEIL